MIVSPITRGTDVRIIKSFPKNEIIEKYNEKLGVDVRKYFNGVEEVILYECNVSGYQFFYPFTMAGDSGLYEDLQKIPWYYSCDKEEHRIVLDEIKKTHLVLEIGCGSGVFLDMLRKKGIEAVGLEFNGEAIRKASCRGLKVHQQKIEDHANENCEIYDVVVFFQVLEHIVDVKGFIEGALKVLKRDGALFVSVPNNDGPYHRFHDDPLNMPPHHMGRWNVNSLIALQEFFPVKIKKITTDSSTPLGWARCYGFNYAEKRARELYGFFGSIAVRIGSPLVKIGAQATADLMPGQTVIAEYRKI